MFQHFNAILTSSPYSDNSSELMYTNQMHSPSSSSRSPMSTSSDTSHSYTNRDENSMHVDIGPTALPSQPVYDLQGNIVKPQLFLNEQPVEKFRFRYKSEMHGTHGSLMGRSSEKSKKSYPTVELRGFSGEAIIRCSLYQTDRDSLERSQHSHRLVVRNGDVDHDDPHDVAVSAEKGYTAVFQGMGIIHTAKKYIADELLKKKILEKQIELGRQLTHRDTQQIKQQVEQEAKSMNLNQVCLCFQAFTVDVDNMWHRLCDPVYSQPINNMKSALTGELKIVRLSAAVSSAAGGDDLILLVEKVGKKNIKVIFFEVDDENKRVWEAEGIFTEVDVHHQYAIALRTPKYKNPDITEPVEVFIELYRPSDQDRSEEMLFKYKPRSYLTPRKKPRMASSSSLSSSEIPTVIRAMAMNASNNTAQISNSTDSITSGLNSDELLNLINANDPTTLKQISMDDNTFETFFSQQHYQYNHQHQLVETIQADGVIQRGPNAPPIIRPTAQVQRKSDPNTIMREISAVVTNKNQNLSMMRDNALRIITENITDRGENILHWAIRSENRFKILMQLFKVIDKLSLEEVLQAQTINEETCLHIACVHNKPEYIRPLINLGADPNIFDSKGNTPLHVAVECSFQICVSKILDKTNYTSKSRKLNIDLANHQGMTALHLAVRKNNLNIVKSLLEAQASTKISETKNGNNVLHIAVEEKNEDIVQFILEHTVIKVNETNSSGYTPLHIALSCNDKNLNIVKLLLKHKADPEIMLNTSGRTRTTDSNQSDDDTSDNDAEDSRSSTTNDPQIRELFQEHKQSEFNINRDIKLEIDENSSMSIDETPSSDNEIGIVFDEDAIISLCQIFNKQEKWKRLANSLGLTDCVKFWDSASNPTKMLLREIERQKVTVSKMLNVFRGMKEPDANTEIDAMIARQSDPDDFQS